MKAGKILLEMHKRFGLNYVIIFGGTDINEDTKDPNKLKIMMEVVEHAYAFVSFHPGLLEICKEKWPNFSTNPKLSTKNLNIFPAPMIKEASCSDDAKSILSSVMKLYSINHSKSQSIDLTNHSLELFILPCGLRYVCCLNKQIDILLLFKLFGQFLSHNNNFRPVKDPLFLAKEFSRWHLEKRRNALLLIIGTTYVEYKDFSDRVKEDVNNFAGVFYHDAVDMPLLFALMLQSVAVVNSSLSEGLSNSLLEAFHFGIPVIARDIEGNRNLIENEKNGLLFSTPSEFVAQAERLLNDKSLRTKLSEAAKSKVNGLSETENDSYVNLFRKMVVDYSSPNAANCSVFFNNNNK